MEGGGLTENRMAEKTTSTSAIQVKLKCYWKNTKPVVTLDPKHGSGFFLALFAQTRSDTHHTTTAFVAFWWWSGLAPAEPPATAETIKTQQPWHVTAAQQLHLCHILMSLWFYHQAAGIKALEPIKTAVSCGSVATLSFISKIQINIYWIRLILNSGSK